jgi:hypothetical protein
MADAASRGVEEERFNMAKTTEKKHCVVDTKTGKRDCFATLAAAKKHLAGLNAASKRPKKSGVGGGCGCGM